MHVNSFRVGFLVLILLAGTAREAKAYTDPGTGALVWQVLIAGFMGALFYFRRIKNYLTQFKREFKRKQDQHR
jgi:hypothetical protein